MSAIARVELARVAFRNAALGLDEAMRNASAEGCSTRAIGRAAGISREAVGRRLKRAPLGVRQRVPLSEPDPMASGQKRAYFAKLNTLDKVLGQPLGTSKKLSHEIASELLGRRVDSLSALDADTASDLLDRVDQRRDSDPGSLSPDALAA